MFQYQDRSILIQCIIHPWQNARAQNNHFQKNKLNYIKINDMTKELQQHKLDEQNREKLRGELYLQANKF